MSKPTKIYELKGEDFAKGLSYKSGFPVGGIWGITENFDPFESYGYLQSSLDAVTANDTTATPVVLTTWNESGTAKLYSHTTSALYEVLDASPYTTVNKSAEINVVSPVTGSFIYKTRYIYAQAAVTKVFSNVLPVASASNIEIFDSGGSNTTWWTPFAVGPDKNLYFVHGDICRITTVSGGGEKTANNGTFLSLESGMYGRDLVNDGRYLVVIADNNLSNQRGATPSTGTYRCQVAFYDVNSGRSTPEFKYEFTDSYVVSVRYLDGVVYIFGKENLWACNAVTAPKSVFTFNSGSTITEIPQTPFQVTQDANSLYWCGQTNNKIYAFGSLTSGTKKIFYQPYSSGGVSSAITNNGVQFYVGTSSNSQMLKVLNTGTTRTLTTSATASTFLPQPYKFAFARVVMKSKLTTGGQVYLGIANNDGNITFAQTKLFTNIGAKQSILFTLENDTTASVKEFNDFKLTIGSNQAIAKVEFWATPIDNYDQNI